MSASPAASHHHGVPKWLILLTVIIGTFLGRLDQTIVDLALPKIMTDFHISVGNAGWIATAYILANAVFVPVWGKLGDTIGRKRVYVLGFLIFIVGSILAGLAWNLSSMIVFRIIQAIAGSADYPTAMAILAFTYTDDRERGKALGIWSSSFAAAAVFGPLLGGTLIDTFGWRSIFLINLPIGLIGVLMALAFIRESRAEDQSGHFDLWGALVLGMALSALVLVLDKGLSWGWLSWKSLACYAVTLASTVAFIGIERRHPDPIVDLGFFRNNVFVQTLSNNFIIFMGMMGCIYLIPIFAQVYLGFDATKTGYLFVPMAAAMMIAAPLGARLAGKVQPRFVIAASTALAAVGFFLFSRLDPRWTAFDLVIPIVIMAFGMGFGMAQRTNIIASVVPKHEMGMASSVLALARNIAGAFGISVFATILQVSANHAVLRIGQNSSFHGTTRAAYAQFVALIELKAQMDAYHVVFLTAAGIIAVGAALALTIRAELKQGVTVHVEG